MPLNTNRIPSSTFAPASAVAASTSSSRRRLNTSSGPVDRLEAQHPAPTAPRSTAARPELPTMYVLGPAHPHAKSLRHANWVTLRTGLVVRGAARGVALLSEPFAYGWKRAVLRGDKDAERKGAQIALLEFKLDERIDKMAGDFRRAFSASPDQDRFARSENTVEWLSRTKEKARKKKA